MPSETDTHALSGLPVPAQAGPRPDRAALLAALLDERPRFHHADYAAPAGARSWAISDPVLGWLARELPPAAPRWRPARAIPPCCSPPPAGITSRSPTPRTRCA